MRNFVLTVAQPGLDAGDALAGFDGRGTGHGAQDGVATRNFVYALAGHGGGFMRVAMQVILPGAPADRKRKMGGEKLGVPVDRTRRELTDEEIGRIAATCHAWRGEAVGAGLVPALHKQGDHKGRPYTDIPGFCKSTALDAIRKHDHVLTPGRYVGAEAQEDDEAFADKMQRLTAQLSAQMKRGAELDAIIRDKLGALGYGV